MKCYTILWLFAVCFWFVSSTIRCAQTQVVPRLIHVAAGAASVYVIIKWVQQCREFTIKCWGRRTYRAVDLQAAVLGGVGGMIAYIFMYCAVAISSRSIPPRNLDNYYSQGRLHLVVAYAIGCIGMFCAAVGMSKGKKLL